MVSESRQFKEASSGSLLGKRRSRNLSRHAEVIFEEYEATEFEEEEFLQAQELPGKNRRGIPKNLVAKLLILPLKRKDEDKQPLYKCVLGVSVLRFYSQQ